jgi:hypothetical protein
LCWSDGVWPRAYFGQFMGQRLCYHFIKSEFFESSLIKLIACNKFPRALHLNEGRRSELARTLAHDFYDFFFLAFIVCKHTFLRSEWKKKKNVVFLVSFSHFWIIKIDSENWSWKIFIYSLFFLSLLLLFEATECLLPRPPSTHKYTHTKKHKFFSAFADGIQTST